MTESTPVRSTKPRQVRPRTEGWTQQKDAEGRPLLQFAAPKKGMPPVHLADLTPEQRVETSALSQRSDPSRFHATELMRLGPCWAHRPEPLVIDTGRP